MVKNDVKESVDDIDPSTELRVLIVDNELENLRILGSLLKKKGYLVHVATGGYQALEIAAAVSPELILLDVLAPDMDGYEVCSRLKSDSQTMHIPVIFLSVRDDRKSVLKGFRLGAVDYITKPYDQVELLVRVKTHTTLGHLMRSLRDEVDQQTRSLHKANRKLTRLVSELVLAEERERHRLATGLHDSAVQKLALSQIQLESLERKYADELPFNGVLGKSIRLVEESIQELRSLLFDLSPPVLYELGLGSALEWIAQQTEKRWSIPISCNLEGEFKKVPLETSILMFQSVRELLANLVRHAEPTKGNIRARLRPELVTVTVSDDGKGFSPNKPTRDSPSEGGFGLFSIKQRMEQLDGEFTILSNENGTQVSLSLPIHHDY